MFCNNCGNQINPGEGFCTKCGTAVQSATPQATNNNITVNQEENKKANMLCVISLILKYGVGVIVGIIYGIMGGLTSVSTTSYSTSSSIGVLGTALSGLASISSLAAFVIMIVVRVKYPKNTFGKVLMWIYIAELILAIIGLVIIIASCAYLIQSCK